MTDPIKAEVLTITEALHDTLGESITLTPADVVALGQLADERQRAIVAHKLKSWDEMLRTLKSVAKLAAPGGRTMDELTRDMSYLCDRARYAIELAERLP